MKTPLSLLSVSLLAFAACQDSANVTVDHRGDTLSIVRVEGTHKYMLLPIEEEQPEAQVMLGNVPMDVRLAVNKVDYTVPFPLASDSLVIRNLPESAIAWNELQVADTFDASNREKFRPSFHHTPAYGWMNDANGLVYKDGEYHLYFQYNPYGSKWGNMHWGHSVSTDLVHWQRLDPAIARDSLGHIFSGSTVVDKDNTAGFGKDAIVAFYTQHTPLPGGHQRQVQSVAYSLDNGRTYTGYEGNPILTPFDSLENFRDPKVFWYAPEKKWVMIVSADKNMRFYESRNLKQWSYMSEWGNGYGPKPNQFECPDFLRMAVDGDTTRIKWVMIVNINPGFKFGGSGGMYFVGDFDGRKFTPDTDPSVINWLDYGKDHYATVCYSNTGSRTIAMPWMSNWQYANLTPTQQFRSANAVARELSLYTAPDGSLKLQAAPVKELDVLRRDEKSLGSFTLGEKKFDNLYANSDGAFELLFDIDATQADQSGVELLSSRGEKVNIYFDKKSARVVMDRSESGNTAFGEKVEAHDIEKRYEAAHGTLPEKGEYLHYSNDFAMATWAPVVGTFGKHTVRILCDRSSVELFVDGGKVAMTNLVFPDEPLNGLRFHAKGGEAKVSNARTFKLAL